MLAICGPVAHLRRLDTPDPITRLNAALEGRYAIQRELVRGTQGSGAELMADAITRSVGVKRQALLIAVSYPTSKGVDHA